MRIPSLLRTGTLAGGLLVSLSASASDRPAVPIPPDHYTKAELTAFRATPSYDETVAFLLRLTKTSPFLHVDWFGTTGMGRRMPVVIASKERAFTPEEAWKTKKPVVLILNGIHAGEIDGKDACLILLRDIALGNRPEILDGVTLLVVPIYNVDGHERVSKYNRPNQNGPADGMGFRTNARGLDLNRDFLKADAPETRALLKLANAWRPDLFVDDHVTDGADFQATLTVLWGGEPAAPPSIASWLRLTMPRVLARVEEEGFKTAPYVEFVDPLDPGKGIDFGPSSPRYSTGYFSIRGVPSILVEMHSIKPYAARVKGNERFLRALLSDIARDPKPLLSAREAARAGIRQAAPGTPFAVEAQTDLSKGEEIEFPTFVWRQEVSPVTGRPTLQYDPSKPITLKLPVFRTAKVKTSVPRPAAYLVPAGWPAFEERLLAHGIRFSKLETARTLEVGTYRASDPKYSGAPYQGRTGVTARIARGRERREVPAGSLYVPLDTELADVAIHLLEPESPDSLFSWGELSTALEMKEYIDTRVLDPLAEEMLAKDPKLKSEWEERLKDPKFAGDSRARWRFFFSKTPYWDETLGLLPVYRLDKPLEILSAPGAKEAAAAAGAASRE